MEEQISPLSEEEIEQRKKWCRKILITTIIMDLLILTGVWIIVWFLYLFFILSYKKDLDQKCFKKILIIWFIPLILLLLLFWWCVLIFFPYL